MSAELTEQHRLLQAQLGANVAAAVVQLWDLLDVERLDATIPVWLDAIRRLVQQEHDRSAELARRYLATHRQLALGFDAAPPPPLPVAELAPQALQTSLLVTGPYRLRKNLAGGVTFDRAVDMARADSAGEAMRHALSGSRSSIVAAANSDPAILGVQRVTSGSPCAFCAMLASRGPVYLSEETAGFKPHSRCGCQPEPVYEDRAPRTAQALVYREQWNEAKVLAREEQISTEVAFRRLHENRA